MKIIYEKMSGMFGYVILEDFTIEELSEMYGYSEVDHPKFNNRNEAIEWAEWNLL